MLAFDYSWSRPNPAAMSAAGVKVVCRYLSGAGKAVSRGEIDLLHAHGIGVVLNWELGATAAAGGAARGRSDGAAARAAMRALGAPAGTACYYSADFDVTGQMSAVVAYRGAADDTTYPARMYGEADVIDACGVPGWQTIAWSRGRVSPHAVLYQYSINQTMAGSAVDYNTVLDPARLAAWWPPGTAYADQPTPPTHATSDEEDDMVLILEAGTSAGFWLSGGKAMTSNSNAERLAHIKAGGQVRTWSPAEFRRGLQAWK